MDSSHTSKEPGFPSYNPTSPFIPDAMEARELLVGTGMLGEAGLGVAGAALSCGGAVVVEPGVTLHLSADQVHDLSAWQVAKSV